MTRRQLLGALLATGLAARARADARVRLRYGSQRRAFGLALTLSELSYDHFDDGSADAWSVLEARAGGRSERVMISVHDRTPRTVTLLGRRLRLVRVSDSSITFEG